MKEQGRSTLSPQATGRTLKRLSGLEMVISPEVVRRVLQDTGRVNRRACLRTREVMVWVVRAMGLLTHLPIRQVFRHARRWRDGDQIPQRSRLCLARQRLGVEPLRERHARGVRPLATADTPGAFIARSARGASMARCGTRLPVRPTPSSAGLREIVTRGRFQAKLAPQPHQPARHQPQNVQMDQKTPSPPTPQAVGQNI